MYIRKTEDEFDIEADYGQGFEVVTCETTYKKAKEQVKAYKENDPYLKGIRVVKRRVPIDRVQNLS